MYLHEQATRFHTERSELNELLKTQQSWISTVTDERDEFISIPMNLQKQLTDRDKDEEINS